MSLQMTTVRPTFSGDGTGGIRLYAPLVLPILIVVTTGTLSPRCRPESQPIGPSAAKIEWTPQEIALFKKNIARDRAYIRWVDQHISGCRDPEARRQFQLTLAINQEDVHELEAEIAP